MVDDAELAAMLTHARELHQSLQDQDDETRAQVLAAVRGRLRSQADAPDAPAGYLLLAAEIIDLLDNPRLEARQAHDLERAFFGHE